MKPRFKSSSTGGYSLVQFIKTIFFIFFVFNYIITISISLIVDMPVDKIVGLLNFNSFNKWSISKLTGSTLNHFSILFNSSAAL